MLPQGGIVGAAAGLATATSGARTVYAGEFQPFIPYKERSAGLKYGGAAMVIGGALIPGLWSDVPVMRDVTFSPTPGGVVEWHPREAPTDENAAQQPVTSSTRHAVWNEMLDAARLSRYAERMESRYRAAQLLMRSGLLLSATASVATLLEALPDAWHVFWNVAIAILIIWDFVMDYATKIAVLNAARRECQLLENDWHDLWQNVDAEGSTDGDIRRQNSDLARRLHRAVAPMDVHVKVSEKINKATTADAYKVTEARYATQ